MRAYLVYMDGVYGWGLAPTLIPNLDMAVVIFKLDGLYLILVNSNNTGGDLMFWVYFEISS